MSPILNFVFIAYLISNIPTSVTSTDPPVSITLTTDTNGRVYWEATKNKTVLWKLQSFKSSYIHLQESDVTVVGANGKYVELLIVDREGTIRSRLPITCALDPGILLHNNRFLVYDYGLWGIAHYQSRSEGIALEKWLTANRRVVAYDFGNHKVLWDKPELMIGRPLSLQKGRLESLCILNISHCLRNNWKEYLNDDSEEYRWHFPVKPQIAVVEREIKTGRIIRCARLRLSRIRARDFYQYILGSGSTKPAKVTWTGDLVRVEGLFRP